MASFFHIKIFLIRICDSTLHPRKFCLVDIGPLAGTGKPSYISLYWHQVTRLPNSPTMAVAIQQLRMASIFSSLFPRIASTTFNTSFRSTVIYTQQVQRSPFLSISSLAIAIPAAISTIPSLLGDIWEGILRAVPKKKTSHMKKRHRQMAGKALKDVTALNKCPACGGVKKMHTLCSNCMGRIGAMLERDFKGKA
ncbi:hypothetical protein GGR54DRAFT_582543 [Hypoxylon sp. NC1633]|nr:hypothetical protein GGR54DRAFT_582543 [Hypoxylon sp. NC1633]